MKALACCQAEGERPAPLLYARTRNDERGEEVVERDGGIVAEAAVHGRGLDDRAARRHQPVEAPG